MEEEKKTQREEAGAIGEKCPGYLGFYRCRRRDGRQGQLDYEKRTDDCSSTKLRARGKKKDQLQKKPPEGGARESASRRRTLTSRATMSGVTEKKKLLPFEARERQSKPPYPVEYLSVSRAPFGERKEQSS